MHERRIKILNLLEIVQNTIQLTCILRPILVQYDLKKVRKIEAFCPVFVCVLHFKPHA